MSDRELAEKILVLAGGKDNISKATHCITRLRLYIKDDSQFNIDEISKQLGLQVIIAGGQHQIVIGPGKVDRVYDEFIKLTGLEALNKVEENDNDNSKKTNIFNRFLQLISAIFAPMLGILAGAGMIKGLTALLVAIGLVSGDSNTFVILTAIGDTFFISLPIFVGYFAMKSFGGTPLLGALLGAILVSPEITAFGAAQPSSILFENTFFESSIQADFFGAPIIVGAVGYTYSVIPVVIEAYFAAKLEKLSKKIYPDSISLFMTPATVILIMSLVTLLVLGPIFGLLTTILSKLFFILSTAVPVVYGALLGGLWQVLVLFGLHWAIVPFAFLQLADYEQGLIENMGILAPSFVVCFSAIGGVLALMITQKDKELNKIALPAFITGIFGITEPAIYGVLIPKKIPFITTSIGGAIGGAYIALTNTGTYTSLGLGVLGSFTFLNPQPGATQSSFINVIIASIIAFISGLLLTIIVYRKKSSSTDTSQIESPVKGTNVDLSEVKDELFKTESLGSTIAIYPSVGKIYAPVEGEITALFPTKHAIGIKSSTGDEILIHIGIDTVNLNGEGFSTHVKQGDMVKKEQLLIEFDIEKIKKEGYDPTVFIAITETDTKYDKITSKEYNKHDVLFAPCK